MMHKRITTEYDVYEPVETPQSRFSRKGTYVLISSHKRLHDALKAHNRNPEYVLWVTHHYDHGEGVIGYEPSVIIGTGNRYYERLCKKCRVSVNTVRRFLGTAGVRSMFCHSHFQWGVKK